MVNFIKYFQVKEPSGGGIRNVQCPKISKKVDLIKIAKDLFFGEENITIYGAWEDVEVEFFDFKQNPLSEDTTVSELYEKSGNLTTY